MYRFYLFIIVKIIELVNIMMVCKVFVKIIVVRFFENYKWVNLYFKYCL